MGRVISLITKLPEEAKEAYLQRMSEEFQQFVATKGIKITHVEVYEVSESEAISDFHVAFSDRVLEDD